MCYIVHSLFLLNGSPKMAQEIYNSKPTRGSYKWRVQNTKKERKKKGTKHPELRKGLVLSKIIF